MPCKFFPRMPGITLLSGLLFLAVPKLVHAQDQIPIVLDRPGTNPAEMKVAQSPVNVYITVREANGLALDQSANVTLDCPLTGVSLSSPSKGASQVQFMHI